LASSVGLTRVKIREVINQIEDDGWFLVTTRGVVIVSISIRKKLAG
jgi:hypothetical protein